MKLLADGRRQCAQCKIWLLPEAFRANPDVRDGLDSWCRPCHAAATREWRAKHREQINASRRAAYRASTPGRRVSA